MAAAGADEQREALLSQWDRAAAGWGRSAQRIRDWAMPVSVQMIEQLRLQPGQQLLELAAGPGDTGFLAAELIRPRGKLITSDASTAMLDVARARAAEQGVEKVEFRQLQLEWIDLPTASVDKILCRWGLMLIVDPGASLGEMRRVLRPGGRVAVAVWDDAARNPWATIPRVALMEAAAGSLPAPDPDAPGMFALAAPGLLQQRLEDAGFVGVDVTAVPLERREASVEEYIAGTRELSEMFGAAFDSLPEAGRAAVTDRIAELTEPFAQPDGSLRFPGSTLVAAADS
jgi:SAM-dependent methyltransferase